MDILIGKFSFFIFYDLGGHTFLYKINHENKECFCQVSKIDVYGTCGEN